MDYVYNSQGKISIGHAMLSGAVQPSKTTNKTRQHLLASQIDPRFYEPLEKAPLASVIVLNHNGEDVLERCLRCLLAQTYRSIEILVVDNHSTDKSLEILDSFAQEHGVRTLRLDHNAGVAGGRNAAVAAATGEIVAFIDNDGFADPDWLLYAVNMLRSDNSIAAVSAAVFFAERPLHINGFGGGMDTLGHARDFNYGEELTEDTRFPSEVLYPMGCGMVLQAEEIQKCFPLDDALPKWFDDTELGVRLALLGKKVLVAYGARVDHQAHSGDAVRIPQGWKRSLLFEKARIRMVLKYFPISYLPLWLLRDFGSTLHRTCKGEAAHIAVWGLALLWNCSQLPAIVRLRSGFSMSNSTFWQLVERDSLRR